MYENYQPPAFAGMKADSGDDRVETFPVGADTPFGVVAGTDANGILKPGAQTKVRGITLHTHTITAGMYKTGDAASVMRRGLVWAVVTANGTVTEDGPVSFSAAGTVSDGDATKLENATFRSVIVTADGVQIAKIELHDPFAVPAAAAEPGGG
ncbi:structural cement protein Gp24 [Achromobacter aloeverae]